jgi:ankyrin repeat protein
MATAILQLRVDSRVYTTMQSAAMQGNVEIMKLLHSFGAEMNNTDDNDETVIPALHLAGVRS